MTATEKERMDMTTMTTTTNQRLVTILLVLLIVFVALLIIGSIFSLWLMGTTSGMMSGGMMSNSMMSQMMGMDAQQMSDMMTACAEMMKNVQNP